MAGLSFYDLWDTAEVLGRHENSVTPSVVDDCMRTSPMLPEQIQSQGSPWSWGKTSQRLFQSMNFQKLLGRKIQEFSQHCSVSVCPTFKAVLVFLTYYSQNAMPCVH